MKLSWCTIHVHDMEQSKSFLREILGIAQNPFIFTAKGHRDRIFFR